MRRITYNTDKGVAPTILAGYFKFGTATLLGGGYGTTGTAVIEIWTLK